MKYVKTLVAALLCAAFLTGCAPAVTAQNEAVPTAAVAAVPTPTPAPDYQYMSAEDAYTYIRLNHPPLIIDLQPQAYFDENGHLENAVSTCAYPVNTDALQQKLAGTIADAMNAESVLLVDMAGKAGARNAYAYYLEAGIDPEKLFILRNGMLGWTRPEAKVYTVQPYMPQYISAKDVRNLLRKEKPVQIFDLRDTAAYDAGHLTTSVSLPAFSPDASAYDIRTALAAGLDAAKAYGAPQTVLVTTAGSDEALLAYDFFANRGADAGRLFILENGMDAWPSSYKHYIETAGDAPATAAGEEKPAEAEAPAKKTAAPDAATPAPLPDMPAPLPASEPTIPPEGIMG